MKKKILVLSGALAMVIAAGAIFFSAKTNSVDQAIFLDNIEALASGEPGEGGSSGSTTEVCYEQPDRAPSAFRTNQCHGGTSTYVNEAALNEAASQPGLKKYACYEKLLSTKSDHSRVGFCYKK